MQVKNAKCMWLGPGVQTVMVNSHIGLFFCFYWRFTFNLSMKAKHLQMLQCLLRSDKQRSCVLKAIDQCCAMTYCFPDNPSRPFLGQTPCKHSLCDFLFCRSFFPFFGFLSNFLPLKKIIVYGREITGVLASHHFFSPACGAFSVTVWLFSVSKKVFYPDGSVWEWLLKSEWIKMKN